MTIFELRMKQEDIGKIVGKEGRTIQALRTIMNGIGGKNNKRVQVEIIEE